jgi:sulfide:quinone oxidoreductase
MLAERAFEMGAELELHIVTPEASPLGISGLGASGELAKLLADAHGRVQGAPDVYAAGDITSFAIKQGGIACQQADAVAQSIAARAGVHLVPEPFHPVLGGKLTTEHSARFMRRDADDVRVAGRALWWPPTKIAGRDVADYLESLAEQGERPCGLPVNVDIGDTGTGAVEMLTLR